MVKEYCIPVLYLWIFIGPRNYLHSWLDVRPGTSQMRRLGYFQLRIPAGMVYNSQYFDLAQDACITETPLYADKEPINVQCPSLRQCMTWGL